MLGSFNKFNGLLSAYGREPFKKIFKRVAGFKIIPQGLDRYTGSFKALVMQKLISNKRSVNSVAPNLLK